MHDPKEENRQKVLAIAQKAGQRWLTDAEFNEQFESGVQIAKDHGDKDLFLQFILFGTPYDDSGEKKCIMPVVFGDWQSDSSKKHQLMMGLGAKFADEFPKHMLTTVVQVSEAWMVMRGKEADVYKIRPSKATDRVEVVLVHALSMDFRSSFYMAKISRDDAGKFAGLETLKEHRHGTAKTEAISEENNLSIDIFRGYMMAWRAHKQAA